MIESFYLSLLFVGGANILNLNEIVIFDRGNSFSSYIVRQSKQKNLLSDTVTDYMDYFNILLCSYHELRHSEQKNYNNMTFEGFFCNVDYYLSNFYDYNLVHNKFFFEIDANWYGINKACNYFKTHYLKDYPKFLLVIEEIYNDYLNDYLTFNPSSRIENLLLKLKFLQFRKN